MLNILIEYKRDGEISKFFQRYLPSAYERPLNAVPSSRPDGDCELLRRLRADLNELSHQVWQLNDIRRGPRKGTEMFSDARLK